MAEDVKAGCARPSGGPVEEIPLEESNETHPPEKGTQSMMQLGKKAPNFTAPGYQNGNFINMNLSDYLGKWVLLCFYPGDFTFV